MAPPALASAAKYERIIRERYGDLADEFLRLYPSSDMGESILAASREVLYGWTSKRLVRSQTAIGQPSFLNLSDHGYPAADAAGLHAFQAAELPYMFGTLDRTPPRWPAIPTPPTSVVCRTPWPDIGQVSYGTDRPSRAASPIGRPMATNGGA